jgi:hypothetical protein
VSLSHETMLDLMAYADGEADADVSARIEKLLVDDAEARDVLAAMTGPVAEVGAFVAREAEAHAMRSGADTIANAVMGTIAKAHVPTVSSLDAARGRREARGRTAVVIAAMVAIAAGVFFYVRSTGDDTSGVSPMASMGPSEAVPASASAEAHEPREPDGVVANAEPPEVTIKSTTSHDVSVLVVPAVEAAANANGNPASVIVWVGDNPGGKN